MHGQKNIKLHNAEQAKPVYQYKNTKIKLYKNNAAIWYQKKNCALKLVDEIILYYDARSKKHQIT